MKVKTNFTMSSSFCRSAKGLAPLVSFALLSLAATPAFSQFVPGDEYYNQPALATINVLPAYHEGVSGKDVVIGIVDTGINPEHVEFRDAIVAGYNGITGAYGTRDFSSFLWDDHEMPHGSHVASIAAGRLDGSGRPHNIQGVAYNATLVIASWDNYAATDELFAAQASQGLRFASAQGARVINNSWGFPDFSPVNVRAENFLSSSPGLTSALMDTLDQGSVIVFAAGNFSMDDPSAPALLPSYLPELAAKGGWITVVSTTRDGTALSYFTNKCGVSKSYCIAAPGGSQYFENDPEGILGADGNTNDGYVYWQGTSMAAPVVSGAVALLAEQFPWMTNKNLATTILTTASRAENPDIEWGRGLLDVGKAIKGPGIFEEDFSANVTAGYASTFSNNISGIAGLIKLGAGSLALTGNNSYTGNTYLNGGTLIAYQEANLGNTASALRFDGGTLKFGANFMLTRDLLLGAQGGTLDLNGYNKIQSSPISGSGRFGVTGGGSFTLDRPNTQLGGLAVQGGSQVNAQRDDYLGVAGSSVLLDQGQLNLLNGFAAAPGGFDRPLEIGPGHGTIDTGNNDLAYTGGTISGGGMLSFIGTPFTLGRDLTLNGVWNSNLEVPVALALKGNGSVSGDLRVLGTLSPGNSPGVLTVSGSVTNAAGSTFNVEIDGPGTGTGAGNYDRLVLTGAGSTYTAGGTLNLLLRGITGAAYNDYQPNLGQGFQFVSAPGGVLGSYATVNQPGAGLLPGTRMDLIFGSTSLAAYVTPASYAQLDAVGIRNNRNRQQIGGILESIRPAVGQRAADAGSQAIFAGLAPQTQQTLPQSLDQLAGVGYAQLLAVNSENTRHMTEQALMVVGRQRRNETMSAMAGTSNKAQNGAGEQVWAMALGRSSRWGEDRYGYGIKDDLSGQIGGAFKRINADTQAGFMLAYWASDPNIREHIGSGQMENLQLMGYASHQMEGGFFLQGVVGAGAGNIDAKRSVSILGNQYDANINTTNVSLAAQGGWTTGATDAVNYEALFGLNYFVQRNSSFKDSTRQDMAELRGEATTNQALVASATGSVNAPFQAIGIDWNFSARVGLSHDLFNPRSELDAKLLGQSYQLESNAIGRTRLHLGMGLTGRIAEHTQLGFDLGYQTAQDWESIGGSISLQIRF